MEQTQVISIRPTSQYGPAVTVNWTDTLSGTYNIDGSFSHGFPMPNYIGGYKLTGEDEANIVAAIGQVAKSGDATTITFAFDQKIATEITMTTEQIEDAMACGEEVAR